MTGVLIRRGDQVTDRKRRSHEDPERREPSTSEVKRR